MNRLPFSLALLSAAIIGLQLALMQILSFAQWHHFAFMIISVALLGFGLSGTLLALHRTWFLSHARSLLPLLMAGCGVVISGMPWLLEWDALRFDSYRVFVEASHARALVLVYVVMLFPFLFGALAIGLSFIREPDRIGVLYFWNLLGSAAGVGLPLVLMEYMLSERILVVLSVLPLVAAVLVLPFSGPWRLASLAVLAGGGAACLGLRPPAVTPSEYKGLSRSLSLPGAEILHERPALQGVVHAVRARALRYAPGVSLAYRGDVPGGAAMYVDGETVGPLLAADDVRLKDVLDHSTVGAAFRLRQPGRVLVLHGGTGVLAAYALASGAEHVTVVEPHAGVVSLMQKELAVMTDSLYLRPSVAVAGCQTRSFLAADTARYDLIVLPPVDAFGGTGGVYAMREQYELTREAFTAMIGRLSPGGILTVSAWLDEPPRNPLRVLGTLVEAFERVSGGPPEDHIIAVRNWGMITFLLSDSRVSPDELRRLRAWADSLLFDPALLPGISAEERVRHNRTADPAFFRSLDAIMSAEGDSFYRAYEYDIAPATDDRPYFSQFLRGASLGKVVEAFGARTFPFLELGYVILLATLAQILAASLLLVALPVVLGGVRGPGSVWTPVYFGGIGLGFIAVEMALIQRAVLILGHPVYAAAATMGGLLLGAGIGSLLSAKVKAPGRSLKRVTVASACGILLGYAIVVPLLAHALPSSSTLSFVLSFLGVAAVGVPMGFPFPIGLRALAGRNQRLLPWAWGVNGSASVLGTALATFSGVEGGFAVVMLGAIGAYLMAAAVSGRE